MANSEEDSNLKARLLNTQQQFGELFVAVNALLFSRDPAGLSMGWNSDEYQFEVLQILERIGTVKNAAELTRVVSDVFRENFGGDEGESSTADEEDSPLDEAKIAALSSEVWKLYRDQTSMREAP